LKETFHEYSKRYPDGFLYWFFNQPVLVVSDPESVKYVLSTNVKNYEKYQEEIILNVIGNGLLLANGDLWKRQRKLMVT
jgi:cytochrome P450